MGTYTVCHVTRKSNIVIGENVRQRKKMKRKKKEEEETKEEMKNEGGSGEKRNKTE